MEQSCSFLGLAEQEVEEFQHSWCRKSLFCWKLFFALPIISFKFFSIGSTLSLNLLSSVVAVYKFKYIR